MCDPRDLPERVRRETEDEEGEGEEAQAAIRRRQAEQNWEDDQVDLDDDERLDREYHDPWGDTGERE